MLKWISHLSFSLLTYIRLLKENRRVLRIFSSKTLIFLIIHVQYKKSHLSQYPRDTLRYERSDPNERNEVETK